MARRPDPVLTQEQLDARARWQSVWLLPLMIAAIVPIFITSDDRPVVEIVVAFGSWAIFVIDLVQQMRFVPRYLRRREGIFDLTIVILTFPWYLLPGASNAVGLLLVARLGRLARVLLATKGLRRFVKRLGKVAGFAGITVLIASLLAWEVEHKVNPEFHTIGDALWWGIVTLTTVGYGDVVPITTGGRLAGVLIMLTGVAVLGVLAGSLAALFGLDHDVAVKPAGEPDEPPAVHDEIAALGAQLQEIQDRLAVLAERARPSP